MANFIGAFRVNDTFLECVAMFCALVCDALCARAACVYPTNICTFFDSHNSEAPLWQHIPAVSRDSNALRSGNRCVYIEGGHSPAIFRRAPHPWT